MYSLSFDVAEFEKYALPQVSGQYVMPDDRTVVSIDKDGNPVNRGSGPSHIFPSSSGNTLPVIIVWPDSDKEWQHYYDQKDKWDDNFKKWIKNHKRELKDYFDQKSKETKTS